MTDRKRDTREQTSSDTPGVTTVDTTTRTRSEWVCIRFVKRIQYLIIAAFIKLQIWSITDNFIINIKSVESKAYIKEITSRHASAASQACVCMQVPISLNDFRILNYNDRRRHSYSLPKCWENELNFTLYFPTIKHGRLMNDNFESPNDQQRVVPGFQGRFWFTTMIYIIGTRINFGHASPRAHAHCMQWSFSTALSMFATIRSVY